MGDKVYVIKRPFNSKHLKRVYNKQIEIFECSYDESMDLFISSGVYSFTDKQLLKFMENTAPRTQIKPLVEKFTKQDISDVYSHAILTSRNYHFSYVFDNFENALISKIFLVNEVHNRCNIKIEAMRKSIENSMPRLGPVVELIKESNPELFI